ncbi:MAG: hypothetical protein ACREYE_26080, partial [Gammaproteobacteria bacterium]
DIIKKIERARVKMEQIKPGSTLPRGKKEGGLTVKLFKGHYTSSLSDLGGTYYGVGKWVHFFIPFDSDAQDRFVTRYWPQMIEKLPSISHSPRYDPLKRFGRCARW